VRVLGKCDHAVANVAGRRHLQLIAEASGASAVV
jgi:hypothetical protein